MKNNASFYIRNVLISLIGAFVILNLFCMFYYNVPIHSACEDGSTDYVWESGRYYIQMNEGIGYGKTNNEGYMDEDDYHNDSVKVLILGSSHLQGLSIPQSRNMSSLLQDMLKENVYNLAIAGHNFKVCISNLEDALDKYCPETVVIETNKLSFTDEEVDAVLEHTLPEIASENQGIVGLLQKSPFLRLAYSQFQSFVSGKTADSRTEKEYADEDSLNRLLRMIREICDKHGCRTIIFYHPTLSVNSNGELIANTDERTGTWARLCNDMGIIYLDLSERYLSEYQKDRILPYGFSNTAVASGHLNVNGHRIIAEELYKVLKEEY